MTSIPVRRKTRSVAIRTGFAAGAGLVIWFVPAPAGLTAQAWHLFAIFVATIVGMVLEPLPMGAIALCGITAATMTRTLGLGDALDGFAHPVIWLVLMAFFISRGFIKTGLGARIAYFFMKRLGRRTIGLGYSLLATDLVLAPAIPSITARAGAVLYPIVRSVAEAFDSRPGDGSERRIGSFLILNSFYGNLVTSAMFLTAMAANPLSVQMASEMGIEITWMRWATAAIVPGLASLLVIPLFLFRFYAPEIKDTPAAAQLAQNRLEEMGRPARGEWIMAATFVLLLCLWIFGRNLHIASPVAALAGLAVLLLARVLSWDDVLRERGAWDTFIWLSTLVMMATWLSRLGLVGWFSDIVGGSLTGMGWQPAFLALSLVYFYSHYFFAGNTAHISSMYAAFLGASLLVGAPPMLAALVLAFFSNLFSCMTHYGTGPAPVLYGSGYVRLADWWRLGAVVSVLFVVIWLVLGGLWWKAIGVW
jgi:DASS family divalent anion:Na+ symporter